MPTLACSGDRNARNQPLPTIHIHLATDLAPDRDIRIGADGSIGLAGHLLCPDPRQGDLHIVVAGTNGLRVALRCRDGEGEGVRSVEQWHPGGGPARRHSFRHGLLWDSPDGDPAIEAFDPQGRQVLCARYAAGVLQDGPQGEPARTEYFPSGQVQVAEHYRHGALHDGVTGEPAVMHRDGQGTILYTAHYDAGTLRAEAPRRRDPRPCSGYGGPNPSPR